MVRARPKSLAQDLWQGPLSDPMAPARDLTQKIEGGAEYIPSLQRLDELSSHGLLTDPLLRCALETWPWSIDVALIALDGGQMPDLALAALQRRVEAQNRRHGALAWARWAAGDADGARRAVADLDPASESHHADRLARAELAILCDDTPEPIPGPDGLRLSLLWTWRRRGAAALARRIEIEIAGFPASPPLWAWLIEAFVAERDFARAQGMLGAFRTRCGANHPEVVAQSIRLALDREDPATARAILATQSDPAAPWAWTPRRHAQHLRCAMAEAARNEQPDYAAALAHAHRALRLYPRNEALRGAWLGLRELCEDWDALAADLMSDNQPAAAAAWFLGRIGQPEAALARMRDARPMPPDATARQRLRTAELHLRCGQPAKAEAALGPPPAAWPLRADHAWWVSEIALARRDPQDALATLRPALAQGPSRMGLILNAARAAFLAGQFDASLDHLARFHALKTAQLGAPPADDLRDLITRDAAAAQAAGLSPGVSPGLAAQRLATAPPGFVADPSAPPIPARLVHYWEGPRSAPVERGLRRWAALHPRLSQTVFDTTTAAQWLNRHAPDLAAPFARLKQPAARADLFRIALIATEGGLFADLDEYPRAPVTPWLGGARAVLVIEEGYGTIANNFLAALPGLPVFARLKARIAARLAITPEPYAWWDTGPAPLTIEAMATLQDPAESSGLRFLSQAEYESRVSTNLPFPHKRGVSHWR